MPEVTYTGWGGRLGKSIGGVIIGVVCFLGSFVLLFLNEGNAVHMARTLEEGVGACVDASADKVDEGNEGKLVHLSGKATTDETLKDDTFGVSAVALKLERKVEIYQWVESSKSETVKQVGGGEKTTTYYYHDEKWVDKPESSANFHKDDNTGKLYQNVGTKEYQDQTKRASDPKLGAFKLTAALIDQMGNGEPLPVTSEMQAALPADTKGKFKLVEGKFYKPYKKTKSEAASPDEPEDPPTTEGPQIGDLRVSFQVLKPQEVSVIAKQHAGSFEPWHSEKGDNDLNKLELGTVSKEGMFTQMENARVAQMWFLRLLGFVVMAVGIFLVAKPIIVFADFLPFVGNIISAVVGVVAVVLALPLTLMTVALAWLFYRPLYSIPILLVGFLIVGGTIYFLYGRSKANQAKKAASGK